MKQLDADNCGFGAFNAHEGNVVTACSVFLPSKTLCYSMFVYIRHIITHFIYFNCCISETPAVTLF